MQTLLHDVRVGLRLLWKDRAFAITAGLTLAVCIGANTALFSVVHTVLLRPLPFAHAERIVLLGNQYPGAGVDTSENSGAPDYYDRLRETTVFEEQAMYNSSNVSVDQNGTPTRVRIMNVTPSFFRLLQVSPQLGRSFTDPEGEVGAEKKALLSYALWQSQFGGDPSVVGRDIRIDSQPYTIVGVMPHDFRFITSDVMLWRPLAFTAAQKEQRHSNNWRNIARLKEHATVAQAQQQVDALNAANLDRFPQYKQLLINARFHTRVVPLQENLVRDVRSTLYLMWGGALFVLLIGCLNVANLVLVRSRARLKELATRIALGAGRTRISRQLITESVLLTLASAAAGLAVGVAALRVLATLSIQDLPRGSEIAIDGVVVAFTLAMAAAIGLLLGLIPIASVLPANVTSVLREEGRGGTSGRGARSLRRVLVVAQVAFAFVLLVGAGLLFASFRQLLAVDPGFDPHGVLTASVSLPRARYKDDLALNAFADEALRRLRALPGVTAAGATDTIPFGDNHSDSVILAEGYQMSPGESVISPNQVHLSPGYFESMRARLVRGRFFDDRDGPKAPKAVIVDEKLAHRFWPNQDPIGRRMFLPEDINNLLAITEKTVFLDVVGVVHDLKLANLVDGNGAVGSYFFPLQQDASRLLTFTLRTATDPAAQATALRDVVAGLDRELPLYDLQTMAERADKSLVTRRSPMVLSLAFGAVALFLSAIGIYGVLAYLVTQRTKEIGIRIALGSSARGVFELVLREGLLLIAAGFAFGAVGAFALRRTMASQLFGVSAGDPIVLAAVTLLLAIVAIAACAVPARRATRIDPIVALAE
ncbi:MAG TPA: ABC transporter permease [Vicinamibacterales bacterium]|nr:ABC transporter permease [Vicinamibacterales bacterium]